MRILIVTQTPERYEALAGLIDLMWVAQIDWASTPRSSEHSQGNQFFDLIITDQSIPNMMTDLNHKTIVLFFREKESTNTPDGVLWSTTGDQLLETVSKLFSPQKKMIEAFLPIRTTLVSQLKSIPADNYLKLSDFKFVRIHKSGENIKETDLKRWDQINWNDVHRPATLISTTLGFSSELISTVKLGLDQTIELFSRSPDTQVDLNVHHRNQQFVLDLLTKCQPNQPELSSVLQYHYDCFFKGNQGARPSIKLATLFQLSHELAHFLIEEAKEETNDRISLGAFLDKLGTQRSEFSLIQRVL